MGSSRIVNCKIASVSCEEKNFLNSPCLFFYSTMLKFCSHQPPLLYLDIIMLTNSYMIKLLPITELKLSGDLMNKAARKNSPRQPSALPDRMWLIVLLRKEIITEVLRIKSFGFDFFCCNRSGIAGVVRKETRKREKKRKRNYY